VRRLRGILREPLVHFAVLGAGLFALSGLTGGEAGRPDEIVVTAGRIEHLAVGWTRARQRPPTVEELDGLIEDHVREEVLYREALALGLDRDDTVVRRRLRQKMEFVTEEIALEEPTEAELQAFLGANAGEFREPSRFSFRHVYLSPDRRGPAARADAGRLLAVLAGGGAAAPQGADLGDPSLLEPEYAAVTARDAEGLFGPEFAARLPALPVGSWAGPVASAYGLHLVLVRERTGDVLPVLDEVRPAVRREWLAARRRESGEALYRRLLSRYRVSVEWPDWASRSAGAASAERP
jgi:hypothetical protein